MYKKITDVDLKFSTCDGCPSNCCTGSHGFALAPLILEDFKETYERFPILFANVDQVFKAVFILHNEKEDCRFLGEDNSCGIYEHRPAPCIMYPISPLFDEIVVDTNCHGVGDEGEFLCNSSGFSNKFYHKRIDGFYDKLQNTQKFLNIVRFDTEYVVTIDGIELFKYVGEDLKEYQEFIDMHNSSLHLVDLFRTKEE